MSSISSSTDVQSEVLAWTDRDFSWQRLVKDAQDLRRYGGALRCCEGSLLRVDLFRGKLVEACPLEGHHGRREPGKCNQRRGKHDGATVGRCSELDAGLRC